MDILFQVSDWIKVIGSIASVGLAIYFIVKVLKTRALARKPMKDAKKKEKAMAQFLALAKELGVDKEKENVKKTDK